MTDPPQGSNHPADPTALTRAAVNEATEAARREDAWLQALARSELAGKVELLAEKVEGIRERLVMQETLRVEQKQDTRNSVDEALTAQKESVAKSEAATAKAIDQLNDTVKALFEGVRRDIDDLKNRAARVETNITGT